MVMAAVIHEKGAPDVFRWEEVEVGDPGPGEVRLRNNAVGVNYVDTYHRRGMPHPWPVPPLPVILGFEAAGEVLAVGPGVDGFAAGDRVAYAMPPHGAYSQERIYPVDKLLRVPDRIDDRTLAAVMLKGLTAQYLLRRTYRVAPGDVILVHAAGGGMGLLLCQWARDLGATVIGTVGSDAKTEQAKAHGCDHALLYKGGGYVQEIETITAGRGVDVVYDGVGRETFNSSLECLAMLGHLVSFGQASGAVPPLEFGLLSAKSATLTRPVLFHYTASREDLVATAGELFDVMGQGVVEIKVSATRPLTEVAQAHRDLEARRTTGSTVFIP